MFVYKNAASLLATAGQTWPESEVFSIARAVGCGEGLLEVVHVHP